MRLKRIVAAMLSLTMVCGAGTVVTDHPAFNVSTAYAEDENPFSGFDEGIFRCEEYSDHIRVKCITCKDSEIVIPEEIHGLPVTEVGTFMKTSYISSGNVEMVGHRRLRAVLRRSPYEREATFPASRRRGV